MTDLCYLENFKCVIESVRINLFKFRTAPFVVIHVFYNCVRSIAAITKTVNNIIHRKSDIKTLP